MSLAVQLVQINKNNMFSSKQKFMAWILYSKNIYEKNKLEQIMFLAVQFVQINKNNMFLLNRNFWHV